MLKKEELDKLYDEYERKYTKAELNYNDTGSPSTYRTMKKYEFIMDIIVYAEEQLASGCRSCKRHADNVEMTVKRWEGYKAANMVGMLDFDRVISDINDLKY